LICVGVNGLHISQVFYIVGGYGLSRFYFHGGEDRSRFREKINLMSCLVSPKEIFNVGLRIGFVFHVFREREIFKQFSARIISINRGRLGRGAEDVSLKNQELMS